jgi:hypothetical protein
VRKLSDKITELAKVIERNISYDASGHQPEKRCPHCGEVIEKEETCGYWIDHKGTLAQEIANHLGLSSAFREAIERQLDDVDVTGDAKKDSLVIVKEILKS